MPTISFVPAVRSGESFGNGAYKSERKFFDIVVDGTSLWERLGKPHDMVSVLCTDFALAETMKAADRLLLRAEADMPQDRRSLFVCAECGDLGWGATTLRITRNGNNVIWSEFGYENNYEETVLFEGYKDVGPFEFDQNLYDSTLLDIVGVLSSEASRSPRQQ